MNPENGHLIKLESEIARKLFGKLKTTEDVMKERMAAMGYEPVPENLEEAAKRKLAGRDEAYVSRTSGGKLSRWAAKKRKARRKMAKESRKKNRKK